jgi:CRISPR-associated protein Cas5d
MTTDDALRVRVHVWGDMAVFTQPPLKVERYSYPVPTASAARGILEAIYWHPQMGWLLEEIWVLAPIQFGDPIMRNEVKSPMSLARAEQQIAGHGPLYFVEDDRTQRYTVPLVDVDYLIVARAVPRQPGEDMHKHMAIFRKRLEQGACYQQPYLGMREYWASFEPATGRERPIQESRRLGSMLFDLKYDPQIRGRGTPIFFDARMERGVIRLPADLYRQMNGYELAFAEPSTPVADERGRRAGRHGATHPRATARSEAHRRGDRHSAPHAQPAPSARHLTTSTPAAPRTHEAVGARRGHGADTGAVARRRPPGGEREAAARHQQAAPTTSPGRRTRRGGAGDRRPGPFYKEHAELVSIARRKLGATDETTRSIWFAFYNYLLSSTDVAQAARWVRTMARGKGDILTPRAAGVYREILTEVRKE